MHYFHTCTGCATKLRFTEQNVGRKGRCPKCKLEFVFALPPAPPEVPAAPPVAEVVPEPPRAAPKPPPPAVILDLPDEEEEVPTAFAVLDAPKATPHTDASTRKVVGKRTAPKAEVAKPKPKPTQKPKAKAKPKAAPNRTPLIIGVAAVLLLGTAAGGYFLFRSGPKADIPEVPAPEVAAGTPAPAPVTPPAPPTGTRATDPTPPKTETPKTGTPPKKGNTPPKKNDPPPEVAAAPATPLALDGQILGTYAGGGGKLLAFHVESPGIAGKLVTYDVAAGKVLGSIAGVDRTARVAVGPDKVFIGRIDGRIVRFDPRTGEQEALHTPPASATTRRLMHLATASAVRGPLVAGYSIGTNQYQVSLLDPVTFAELKPAIRNSSNYRSFPITLQGTPTHLAASANGQTFVARNAYTRDEGGYTEKAVNASAALRPTPDGGTLVGNSLWTVRNGIFRTAPTFRWFLPAGDGPFFLSLSQPPAAGRPQSLRLHAEDDSTPLGDLPVPTEAVAWLSDTNAGPTEYHKQIVFLADPGLVVFTPPNGTTAYLQPVDLPALLAKADRGGAFTTVPLTEATRGQPYTYAARAVGAGGAKPKYTVAGPQGVTVSQDGLVAWTPDPTAEPGPVGIYVTATFADGKSVMQHVGLSVVRPDARTVAAAPPVKATTTPPTPPVAVTKTPADPPPAVVAKTPPKTPADPPTPAALPTDNTPPASRTENVTVKLPGAVKSAVVGGGGKFLILHIPKVRQIAVFDAAAGKVVKYIPTAEDGALVAAGLDHLFVANPTAGVIQRYSLKTFEKELTVQSPIEGAMTALVMGSASRGPLLAAGTGNNWGSKTYLIDPVKMQLLPADKMPVAAPPFIRASADGKLFGWRNDTGSEGHSMTLIDTSGDTPKPRGLHTTMNSFSTSLFLPGPDSRFVYSGDGVYTADFKKVHPTNAVGQFGSPFLPAATGSVFMQLNPGAAADPFPRPGRPTAVSGRVGFFLPGQTTPFAHIDKVEGLEPEAYQYGRIPESLFHDQRVHLFPEAGRLVTIPASNDQLMLYPFNQDDLLAKSGTDYLLVASDPPTEAAKGSGFTYTPAIKSKKGGATVKIESGPAGMTAAGGKVVWNVPADFAEKEVTVIMAVSDASGQELFQNFKLTVRDRRPDDPAPLPGTVAKADPPKAAPATPPAPVGAIRPTPLKTDKAELSLPAAATDLCLGGGGRFVIYGMPSVRQLAVFDANEGKVVKYLPTGDGAKFAAGQDKLFVVMPNERIIQRWGLEKLEKELTVPLAAEGEVKCVLLGHASTGPLFVGVGNEPKFAQAPSVFLDQKSMKPVEMKAQPFHGMTATMAYPSADGSVVVGRNDWRGAVSAVISGTSIKMTHSDAVTAIGFPSADGRYVYGMGISTSELKPIVAAGTTVAQLTRMYMPAAHGPFFASQPLRGAGAFGGPLPPSMRKGAKGAAAAGAGDNLDLYVAGQTTPFASTPAPDVTAQAAGPADFRNGGVQSIPAHKRLVWIPSAKVLVGLAPANDKILLQRLDIDELLKNSTVDYLVVLSVPPSEAVRGGRYEYPLDTRSKAGAITLRLESGPPGMRVSGTKLTWDVPKTFAENEAAVILTVADGKGQETFHNFRVTVRDARDGEAVAVAPKGGAPEKAPDPPPPPAIAAKEPAPVGGIRAPKLAGESVTVNLPDTVSAIRVGGGGRFLIAHLPKSKQLAVFDANEAKVVRYIPVAGENLFFAAGADKLLVAYADSRTLVRYSLSTFEKELTVPLPAEGVTGIAMGSASAGPLLLATAGEPVVVDVAKMRKIEGGAGVAPGGRPFFRGGGGGGWNTTPTVRASADGRVFTIPGRGIVAVSPDGKTTTTGTNVSPAYVSADGETIFGNGMMATAGGTAVGQMQGGHGKLTVYIPAAHGPFFLSLVESKTGGVGSFKSAVHAGRDQKPILEFKDLPEIGALVDWTRGSYPEFDGHVFYTPSANLLVTLPASKNQLVLRPLDLRAELNKGTADYLFVTDRPPPAVKGGGFTYTPEVWTKKGGVKLKLEAGPDGMQVSGNSVVWNVPKDADSSNVVLTVSDASGQEVLHTFQVAVREARAGEAAPKAVAAAAAPPAAAPKNQPPMDLAVRPADLAKDEVTVPLPSSAAGIIPAAGGRFLLINLPKERKLAVFDTTAAKVVKYLPVPEAEAKIAAGREKLIILLPGANVIQRWSLATLERELTVANPITHPLKSLSMGSNSDGPLVAVTTSGAPGGFGTAILLYDAKTFKSMDDAFVGGGRGNSTFHPQYPPEVRVSANGDLITAWVWGLSPSGVSIWSREGAKYKGVHEHDSWGVLTPDPEGKVVYANGKVVTTEAKKLADGPTGQVIPAVAGPMLLSLAGEGGDGRVGNPPKAFRASVHMDRSSRPLVTLPALKGLEVTPREPGGFGGGGAALGLEQRVHLIPDAKLLVIASEAGDKLHLHKFDVDAILEKAGVDYLFVTGRPGGATRGATFKYTPAVKSKQGGVKIKLDAGPDGMKVVNGELTWAVPRTFADATVPVILTVSDKTGQETFHTFTLSVGGAAKP